MAGKKNIPMRIVKEKTGLTSRQIRYYDQMGLIFPDRTKGNQRLFSEDDIKRLEKIKSLLEEGYTIEVVKKKLNPPTPVKGNTILFPQKGLNRYFKGELSSLYPDFKNNTLRKIKRSEE
ncbi:MAG: MerR family transcriptional regulator, glutamine synthetase repressor [Halanaerobiales bacterium]|nr:MerR family transcriptional regulator, glutamine synthetase repressor [Halanaerobiales bacterium]